MYKIPASTLFLGKNIVFMPECHSTNTHALQLCQHSNFAPEGTLVITDNQTSGRGQRGNSWTTNPGENFTFSIILKPSFLRVRDQFLLTVFTSLSIYDYLSQKGCKPVRIKWPNDVYVGAKKICGMLIENVVSGDGFSAVVIGIGLNVNQTLFVEQTATSMAIEMNRHFDLREELDGLLALIEARYLKLKAIDFQSLKDEYISLMYWRGEHRTFSSDKGYFDGVINGVDEYGKLKMKTANGDRTFDLKEISYVK